MKKEIENKIIDSLAEASDLIDSGVKPNDALLKVAEKNKLSPNYIQLMVQAYNNGQTNYQLKSAGTDPHQLEFPLADFNYIIKNLYSKDVYKKSDLHQKAAVSRDYEMSPELWVQDIFKQNIKNKILKNKHEKTAQQRDSKLKKIDNINKAIDILKDAENKFEDLRLQLEKSKTKIASCIFSLKKYFNAVGLDHPFPLVYQHSVALFGKKAQAILSKLKNINTNWEKQAVLKYKPADWSKKPYLEVKSLIEEFEKFAHLNDQFKKIKNEYSPRAVLIYANLIKSNPLNTNSILNGIVGVKEKLACLGDDFFPSIKNLSLLNNKKKEKMKKIANNSNLSNLFSEVSTGMNQITEQLANQLSSSVEHFKLNDYKDSIPNMELSLAEDLNSPPITTEKEKARFKFFIHNLLTNDPVLSTYPVEQVIDTYNEIATLAPYVARREALVKPFLKRYLAQGALDIYDVVQLAQLEKTLREATRPIPPVFYELFGGSRND
jgi:hypothetical protein